MASFEISWRRSTDFTKLSNSECAYRVRVGDYRIVYEIWDDDAEIEIQRIRHRREVYR